MRDESQPAKPPESFTRPFSLLQGINQTTKTTIQIVLLLGSLLFLVYKFYQSWNELAGHSLSIDVPRAIAAIAFLVLGFLVMALTWTSIVARQTTTRQRTRLLGIWSQAQLLKYLPGGIWGVLARFYLGSQESLTRTLILASLLLESMLLLAAALFLSLFAVGPIFIGLHSAYLVLVTITFGLVLVFLIGKLAVPMFRRLDKNTIETIDFENRSMPLLFIRYATVWLIVGTGFSLLVSSTYSVPLGSWPVFAGLFFAAWAVGFLVLFAPGGLGVREAILVLLLERVMPTSSAVAISLMSRLWWMSGEAGLFLALALVQRIKLVQTKT